MTGTKILKILVMIIIVLLVCSCTKEDRPAYQVDVSMELEKDPWCDHHAHCRFLRHYEETCRLEKKEFDCRKFVDLFRLMAPVKDCKRNFDTAPVPSIWLCDIDQEEKIPPKLTERSVETLSVLNHDFARKFYASELFRSLLDGEMAQKHGRKSLEMEKKLKK